MEVSVIKKKFAFSGHESFQCRQLWLKKGYDFVRSSRSFSDADAVVELGVGKNMVSSIRYWLRAFNVTDANDQPTEFGIRLLDNKGWDPFLEDEGSLWLLHYQLVKSNLASTYNLIFNHFRREKIVFDKEAYVNYLRRQRELIPGLNFNEKTVRDDFTVFVKMYRNDPKSKDVEDSFSGILSDLKLVSAVGAESDERFAIENLERDNLPAPIFLFAILDNESYGNSISLNSLEQDCNSPGAIFAINRAGIMNKLAEITGSTEGTTFTDHAGIKELQFKEKPEAFAILDQYYGH